MTDIAEITVELSLEDGQYRARIQGAGREAEDFARRMQRMGRSVERTERRVRGFTSTLRDWTLIIGQARNALNQIHFLTTRWAQSVIDANREIERMTFLMKGLSTAATEAERLGEATANVERLFDMAKSAPFEMNALADAFVKMKAGGVDPLNGSLQSLVDATAAFGGTSEIFKRAAIAIQQMSGKGVVSMEELRQQLGEAVPGAINLMARSMGISMGELVDLVSSGTVEAKSALAAMFREFERTFGGRAKEMMSTFNGQLSIMKTRLTELQVKAGGMKAFFTFIKTAMEEFNKFLASPKAMQFASDLGHSLTTAAQSILSLVQALYQYRDLIVEIGTVIAIAIGGRLVLGAFSALGGRLGKTREALRSMTTDLRTMNRETMTASRSANRLSRTFVMVGGDARYAARAIRGIGAAAVALVGTFGLAIAAAYAFSKAIGFFTDSHRGAINAIKEGQAIYDRKELESREAAVVDLRSKIVEARETVAEKEAKVIEQEKKNKEEGARVGDDWIISLRENELARSQDYLADLERDMEVVSQRVNNQRVDFLERAADLRANEMLANVRASMGNVSTIYQREIADLNEEAEKLDLTPADKMKREIEILKKDTNERIRVWEGYLTDSRALVEDNMNAANPDTAFGRALGESQAQAQAEINRLRENLALDIAAREGGPVTISPEGDDSGGSGGGAAGRGVDQITRRIKAARDGFARAARDIATETAYVKARLEDAFAYAVPRDITDLQERLSDIGKPLKEIAAESPEAANALAQLEEKFKGLVNAGRDLELGRVMLDLKETTRDIGLDLMNEKDRREQVFKDEVDRLNKMKAYYVEHNQWRAEQEQALTEHIKALREELADANKGALGEFGEEWKSMADNIEQWGVDSMKGLSDQIADFVTTGKLDFKDFATSAIKSLMRIVMSSAFSKLADGMGGGGGGGFLSNALSMAGNLLRNFVGGSMSPASSPMPVARPTLHGGGIAGMTGGMSRMVDPRAFAGAPRYHTGGIAGDEVPAILKRGEGVFTEGQMAALGKSKAPSVQFNVINQSGQPVSAEQGNQHFDGEKMILDVVLRAVNRPGAFRDNFKSSVK